jgi:hypothetical protein
MKIKVHTNNLDKLQAALDDINGLATEHTYTNAQVLIELRINASRRRRDVYLSERQAVGMRVRFTSGVEVPKTRYTYTRIGTTVELTLCATGWFLTAVRRATLYNDGGSTLTILTPDLKQRALDNFQGQNFTVALPRT